MKKGEVYTGTVERMDFPNRGIVTIDGETAVVKNALIRMPQLVGPEQALVPLPGTGKIVPDRTGRYRSKIIPCRTVDHMQQSVGKLRFNQSKHYIPPAGLSAGVFRISFRNRRPAGRLPACGYGKTFPGRLLRSRAERRQQDKKRQKGKNTEIPAYRETAQKHQPQKNETEMLPAFTGTSAKGWAILESNQ